jgi:leader peptidase (prepilin peptidase)/N-methyltransferase
MIWLFPLVVVFVLGAIIGSFLNVVIHRYPREQSIVFPGSRCPECFTPIKPYDNIPILSWLLLMGRCRSCKAPISAQYILVELANALFYVAAYLHVGLSPTFFALAAIVSMTIALIYIDLQIQILPDVIDLPGVVIGVLIGASEVAPQYPGLRLSSSIGESLVGAGFGAGVLLAISLTYKLIRKVEGMGLGDVKMMAMIGAIVGWQPLFFLLLLSSVTGAVAGLIVAARHEEGIMVAIPFGVFLGIALLVVIFFGPTLWAWYLSLLAR